MKSKKSTSITLAAVITIAIILTACGSKGDDKKDTSDKASSQIEQQVEGNIDKIDEMGFQFEAPKAWKKYEANQSLGRVILMGDGIKFSFAPTEALKKITDPKLAEASEEKQLQVYEEFFKETIPVCGIIIVNSAEKDEGIKKEKEQLIAEYKEKEKVGKQGDNEYYLVYNKEFDISKLSDEGKKALNEITGGFEEFKKSIKIYKPIIIEDEIKNFEKLEFDAKTLSGDSINNQVFKGKKLTMVNIWATYCGPCVEEMEDLQALYEEISKDNMNLIGIVSDTPGDDTEPLAKKILEKKGAKFTNIIPDKKLLDGILSKVSGVPTTIFVDEDGNIVGEIITASRSKDEYRKEINKVLEELK